VYTVLGARPEGNRNLENLDLNGKIILKWNMKCDVEE
jgi:hypothetical protein